jgi:hypothetical protein
MLKILIHMTTKNKQKLNHKTKKMPNFQKWYGKDKNFTSHSKLQSTS